MLGLAALLLVGLPALAAGQVQGPPAPWVPDRVLVTFDPAQARDCIHCALSRGSALPTGLAQAMTETGATRVTPLLESLHAPTVDGMYVRYRHRIDAHAHIVNPARARRALHWEGEAEVAKRVLNTFVVDLPPGTDPRWAAVTYLERSPAVIAARPEFPPEQHLGPGRERPRPVGHPDDGRGRRLAVHPRGRCAHRDPGHRRGGRAPRPGR
jgi:hypothetical protein